MAEVATCTMVVIARNSHQYKQPAERLATTEHGATDMTKQDYAAMIKAGEQIEPTNGAFPEEYMEALYEYIDSTEES